MARCRCGRLWKVAGKAVEGCGRLWKAVEDCGGLWKVAAHHAGPLLVPRPPHPGVQAADCPGGSQRRFIVLPACMRSARRGEAQA